MVARKQKKIAILVDLISLNWYSIVLFQHETQQFKQNIADLYSLVLFQHETQQFKQNIADLVFFSVIST